MRKIFLHHVSIIYIVSRRLKQIDGIQISNSHKIGPIKKPIRTRTKQATSLSSPLLTNDHLSSLSQKAAFKLWQL
jgi:hypothetical protein